MKGEMPRKGDMAMIYTVRLPYWKHVVGTIVSVMSDPYFDSTYRPPSTVVDIDRVLTSRSGMGDEISVSRVAIEVLLRIPPDEEAKRLFAEKEKELQT